MKKLLLLTLILFSLSRFAFSNAPSLVSDEELNSFIRFDDDKLYSAHLKIYNVSTEQDLFIVNNFHGMNYFVPDGYFVKCDDDKNKITLVNISLPGFTMKDNVFPFLHPHFFIKFIYVLNRLSILPNISDAMRTYNDQQLYLRRGWSNVGSSPHMVGMAGDLTYCTPQDKKLLQELNAPLGIRYLEHGRKYNRHVHIQDNELWKKLDTVSVANTCGQLSTDMVSDKFVRGTPYKEYGKRGKGNAQSFKFYTDSLDMVRIVIEDNLGRVKAEISCGVFEIGSHQISIDHSFLKDGIYQFKYYINGVYSAQQVVAAK